MAHVAKYNRSSTGHMFAHYERRKDEKGNYINFSNENIDTTKTHLNYNLAEDKNQIEFLRERLSEVKCLKRKDVNVFCSWAVTKPKDLPQDLEEKFFKETYKFLENRYKKENVVSSYVHMDEVTPHMHFAFIPIALDKKKNIEKVSAKEVITKRDLQTFHTDLEKHLEKELGYKINILNEATKEGNKEIIDLKKETLAEQYKRLDSASKTISKGSNDIKGLSDKLRKISPEKTFTGKLKLTNEEYSILISLANQGGKKIKENIVLQSNVNALKRKIEELEHEQNRKTMYEEINRIKFKDYDKIKRENKELKQSFERVEQAINNLDMVDKVNEEIKSINTMERRKSFNIDR